MMWMTLYIAFLRAINAGPGRTVKMSVLRQSFESLGFTGVETFYGTGNILFQTQLEDPKKLEGLILEKLREVLGYNADAFIRTLVELAELAAWEPFTNTDTGDWESNIIFLPAPLNPETAQKLESVSTDFNRYRFRGREIYWLRRKKPGSTEYEASILGKLIPSPYTVRGARTIYDLAEKLSKRT